MMIHTSRFGSVAIKPEDIVTFPGGLVGYESCKRWVLLADAELDSVGWLQSTSLSEVAMAVISHRRFFPEYQVRVNRGQLTPLDLNGIDQAFVLNILAQHDGKLTVNLRAPLIVNLNRRLGRQVITSDDQPVQCELALRPVHLRKTA
jgi:flagellar assembly factor FliW